MKKEKKKKIRIPELSDADMAALVEGARHAHGSRSLERFVDKVMEELNRPRAYLVPKDGIEQPD